MIKLYVIDTCALISFFHEVFGEDPRLSPRATGIIGEAIYGTFTQLRVSIPSVVFIEIYEKWLRDEEFTRKFFYEVFTPITQSSNVEIKPIDREVLESLFSIGGNLAEHDVNDKIVLASAVMLATPLITLDEKITEYVKKSGVIPSVIQ